MKCRFITPLRCACLVLLSLLGSSAAPVPTLGQQTGDLRLARLRITVVDLRSRDGQLIYGVFTAADGFPSEKGKSVNWQVKRVDADKIVFECELPPGLYGASALHDENSNNRMDLNFMGIPSEGYCVTNDPKPRFRQATFKESTFQLPPEGATLTMSVQYF